MHTYRTTAVTLGSVLLVVLGCSGGSSAGDGTGSTTSGGAQSGSPCTIAEDGGSTSSSSRVCASNPSLAGCKMCLELPAADAGGASTTMTCVFACRLDQQDCPSGQTCTPQPNGSRDSQGTCRNFTKSREVDELGYCK